MTSRWVLDTSALLALRDDEDGHPLSGADAWIAAAAQQEGAVLVHKDPEFTPLSRISQEWIG